MNRSIPNKKQNQVKIHFLMAPTQAKIQFLSFLDVFIPALDFITFLGSSLRQRKLDSTWFLKRFCILTYKERYFLRTKVRSPFDTQRGNNPVPSVSFEAARKYQSLLSSDPVKTYDDSGITRETWALRSIWWLPNLIRMREVPYSFPKNTYHLGICTIPIFHSILIQF